MGDGERELAAQLLDRAADDVAAASALLEVAGVSDAIVGFHAQQAVEKAIKAVLSDRYRPRPRIRARRSRRRRVPRPCYATSLRYGELPPASSTAPRSALGEVADACTARCHAWASRAVHGGVTRTSARAPRWRGASPLASPRASSPVRASSAQPSLRQSGARSSRSRFRWLHIGHRSLRRRRSLAIHRGARALGFRDGSTSPIRNARFTRSTSSGRAFACM